MYKEVFLILDKKELEDEQKDVIEYISKNYDINVKVELFNKVYEKIEDSLYLLYLSDENIKIFFQNHINTNINIAIFPNALCSNSIRNYGISKNMSEAIEDAFNPELLSKIDLLKCNNSLAFNRIVIGDMHGMNRVDYDQNSRLNKIKIFFHNLINISFKSYTLTTSKEHSLKTAASGITILEHSTIMNKESAIKDELSIHDGKLNAYILAPTSLLSYVWYLISIFFYQKISLVSLPKSLGFIKTSKLSISSQDTLDYKIDHQEDLYQADIIELEALKDCLNIHLGRVLIDLVKSDENSIEEKDVVKVNTLPKSELSSILIGGKLPLFKKATDEEFKDLLVSLKDSANFSYIFLTLMILSTLLATTGLFANSAPVIIGAMILAPLMAPIISLSMGVIRADRFLLIQSSRTLAIGVFMALVFSSFYTLFIPLEQITPEMRARLNPNLLDLMVAIFSGIAGAYATSKEEVAKSLAGVAIAVALVPPLSVTGIGIGLWNFDVIYGSFLLFITNLVGITLSAALTFIILGYAPIKRAKKGLFLTSVMMSIITIPLFFSFLHMVKNNNYIKQLKEIKSIIINNKNLEIEINSINERENSVVIDIQVTCSSLVTKDEYYLLKNRIEKSLDKKVLLKVTPKIVID